MIALSSAAFSAGDGSAPVWFGGDQGLSPFYRKGVLYFYDNTVVVQSSQAQAYHIDAVQLQSAGETLDARNNIFAAIPATAGAAAPLFGLLSGNGVAYFGANWVSAGTQLTADNGGFTGHAGGVANLLVGAGADPGFVSAAGGDFHLAAGSAAIDAGGRLAGAAAGYPALYQYVDPRSGKPRAVVGAGPDLGAFEYGD